MNLKNLLQCQENNLLNILSDVFDIRGRRFLHFLLWDHSY